MKPKRREFSGKSLFEKKKLLLLTIFPIDTEYDSHHMLPALNVYFNGLITLEICGGNVQMEQKL